MEAAHFNIADPSVERLVIDIEGSYFKLDNVRSYLKIGKISGTSWPPTTRVLSKDLPSSLRSSANQFPKELGRRLSNLRTKR